MRGTGCLKIRQNDMFSPDVDNLHGAGCYRQWVSLGDALVLAGIAGQVAQGPRPARITARALVSLISFNISRL